MRRLLLAFLTCVVPWTVCRADFNSAETAYEHGQLAQAGVEFQRLAALGDPRAQYNLALMLANGHGIPRDLGAALGWALAAQDNGIEQAAGVVAQLQRIVKPEQAAQAQEYPARFGQAALVPVQPALFAGGPFLELRPKRQIAIVFPDAALWSGTLGWVNAFVTVTPDGDVSQIWFTSWYPDQTFEDYTQRGVELAHFDPVLKQDRPVTTLAYVRFKFVVGDDDAILEQPPLLRQLHVVHEKADQGDSGAQLVLGLFGTAFRELQNLIGPPEPWLLKSAQAGNPAGSLEEALCVLLCGCHGSTSDALSKLVFAGRHGTRGAIMLLALMAQAEGSHDGEVRALRWLRLGAQGGYGPAMERLANLLASSPYADVRDPSEAEAVASQLRVSAQFDRDPDVWQLSATAAAALGDYAAAVRDQDHAIALARDRDWTLTALQARRDAFSAHTLPPGYVIDPPEALASLQIKKGLACDETARVGTNIPECN